MQLYTGFFRLREMGLVDLKLKKKQNGDPSKGIISALVNGKKVVYDALDGYNWIQASAEDNLEYFSKTFKPDFYFKRSYHKELYDLIDGNFKIFPLGLNYNIHPDSGLVSIEKSLKSKIKHLLKENKFFKQVSKKGFLHADDFEYFPVIPENAKILFVTRLWDPDEASLAHTKKERAEVNDIRVECIKTCRSRYNNSFTGGLIMNEFTSKKFKEYAVSSDLSNKLKYVKLLKQYPICITTTGLHNSIGWKFSEYVAASRGIISEPLKYELPGNFKEGENYLSFTNPDQLVQKVDYLISNSKELSKLMINNFQYYNNYLKPEVLVLNTLLTINNSSV